ncbi:MAG: hypothetical protein ACQEQS_01550 [Thermodesulfobacteriota bacterium]
MKKCMIFFLFFTCAFQGYAQEDYEFRDVKWGMSRVEVIAAEEMKPLRITKKYISYKFELMGSNIFLLYEFFDNSLSGASYVYETSDDEKFSKILQTLKIKYGKPEKKNNDYFWKTEEVEIYLKKNPSLFKIKYSSRKMDKYIDEYKEEFDEKQKEHLLSIF